MCGRIVELLGEVNKFLVAHLLGQSIHCHCAYELLVPDGLAILEYHSLVVSVDFLDGTMSPKEGLLFRECVRNSDPNAACATIGRKAEGCIGTPVTRGFFEDDIFHHEFHIRNCDTLTEPFALHLKALDVN